MPSVSRSAMSTTRPAKKPATAPVVAPRTSATATSVTRRMSGTPPRTDMPEKTAVWTTAATNTTTPTLSASTIIGGLPSTRRLRLLDEHEHGVEGGEVHERIDLDALVDVRVELPDARDDADGDPTRVDRREPAGAPAGGDDDVACPHDVLLRDAIEDERLAAGDAVADDAGRVRAQVERGDGARLVGEQRHPRAPARHLRHSADEPRRGDNRVVEVDARVRAGGYEHLLLELARRAADDARGDAVVVAGEGGALAEAQQPPELGVLAHGRLVLDRLLAETLVLPAELLVLRLRIEHVARPAVQVFERLRDALGRNLERVEDGGAGALDVVERPARGLAEVHAQERERDDDEAHDDRAANEGLARLRRRRCGGHGPPSGRYEGPDPG